MDLKSPFKDAIQTDIRKKGKGGKSNPKKSGRGY